MIKLKKLMAVASALCMCAVYVPVMEQALPESFSLIASADESVNYGGIVYRKYEDHAEVWNIVKNDMTGEVATGDIIIPAEVDGLPVTVIKNKSLSGPMSSVVIPNSVTTIESYAFAESPYLTSVTLPDSITTIPEHAFEYCRSLTSVTIPDSITAIEQYAFYNCTALTSITIPDSVTTIESNAFVESGLTSITIPDSITTIQERVFQNCNSLTSVTIPDSVTKIGNSAFSGCRRLKSITIPESVTSIGESAFLNCQSLESVIIPENVRTIGIAAFYLSGLQSITILNPNCIIGYGSGYPPYTIYKGVIYGYLNSTAQVYAQQNRLAFIALEDQPEELAQGDANGDNTIDILDVITVNKAVLGLETLTEDQIKAVDFNGNGKPDSEEALTLMKYIVKIITDFTEA